MDRADVLHVIGYRDPVGTYAMNRARQRKIPYLLEPVGMHRPRLRSITAKAVFEATLGNRLVADAALVIATSQLEKVELVKQGVTAKIRIRPNGVDDEVFQLPPRGSYRSSMGIPQHVPLVLSLGRIARKKQLHHLALALARLPDVWGAVVGPDDGDGGLKDLVAARARLGIENRLIIDTAGAWGMRKRQALADADCFCLPSEWENFGTAALEGAAAALPVVISDRCGGAEWLARETSRVVPFGDVSALTEALDYVLKDEAMKRHSVHSAAVLRDQLNWNEIAHRQAELYDEVLHG